MSPLSPLATSTTETAFAHTCPGYPLGDSDYLAYYKRKTVPAERDRPILLRAQLLQMISGLLPSLYPMNGEGNQYSDQPT